MMIFDAERIITCVSFASSIVEVVIPCSRSMPSTPKKSFEQLKSLSAASA